MKPIDLVTGASGLLGGNLARRLGEQGRRVRILARPGSQTAHLDDLPGLEKVPGDLADTTALVAAMRGVEHVYHCAARVALTRRMQPAIWQSNVVGTENILAAAQEAGVRRLVHCSSVDALGLPEPGQVSNEDSPWNWDTLGVENAYARSKYEAQQRVWQAAQGGLEAVIVCPTYMFGAYDVHPSSGQMILQLAKSPAAPGLKGGNNFVDVLDVADGMIAAAEAGRTGQTYILGNANLTYDEVFALIGQALGKKARRLPLPGGLAWAAGLVGDWLERAGGREAAINSASVRLGQMGHYYDPSKAVRELGLARRPVEGALARAVAWFRATGRLA
jgi:dihydroflavonol-4-reductase